MIAINVLSALAAFILNSLTVMSLNSRQLYCHVGFRNGSPHVILLSISDASKYKSPTEMEMLAAHSYLDLADTFMSPNSSIKVVSLGAVLCRKDRC